MATEYRPIPRLAVGVYPLTNVTPFTYRDGVTYERLLHQLIDRINTIIGEVNTNNQALFDVVIENMNITIDAVNAALGEQTDEVDQKLADLTEYVDIEVAKIVDMRDEMVEYRDETEGFRDQAELFAANTVALQDAAVAALIATPGSDTQTQLDATVAELIDTPGSETQTQLNATFVAATVITPGVNGVVGDGITDDTAAIQALINATPIGGTVMFTRPASGNSWIIDGNLQVTTRNLRITSAGRDSYAVSLTKKTGTGAIITVKAPGFIAEGVNLIGDGLDRGEGATITGFDFYGSPDGDIDAFVVGGSFYRLAVGIRTRSRNIRVKDNLFSNSRNGVTVEGKDAGYHTVAADVVRGIIISENRFHSMGFTATDAAVEFKDSLVDFRHAEVNSNYFDMFGNGRGVVAAGTASTPLKSLTMVDNKHQDIRSEAYHLTYLTDMVLAPSIINGDSATTYDYDGIVLDHCVIGVVTTPFITRTGRSGIKGTNNSGVRVVSPVIQNCGRFAGSTGHGLDFDSTNSQMVFINPVVQGVDGYGFNGSPTSSRLQGGEFRACTLGRISSTTLRAADRFKGGSEFTPITGAPTTASIESYACMMFDPDEIEQVTAFISYPADWFTYNIEVWWLNTVDAAGDVRFQVGRVDPVEGEPVGSGAVTSTVQSVTVGAVNRVKKFTIFTDVPATEAGVVGVRVARRGVDGVDTYASDVGLVGVRLVQVI